MQRIKNFPNQEKRFLVFLLLIVLLINNLVFCQKIDMRPHWNDKIALENPDKGWYHHFPDNNINKYIIHNDSDLLAFPGMDHIYIRLSWGYLEPEEGKFNWKIIDDIINKWTALGMKVSFRISCKETSTDRIEQQFATPKWVMEAGAKGDYYRSGQKVGPDGPWEPVFDDPVFLEKLENFLRAFAERYDGKPWVRYVDIGSIGDWGEGHTSSGSRIDLTFDQRKIHIDLYLKYFKKTQLIISDDFVYSVTNPQERSRLHQFVVQKGISYRDDSPLVNGYFNDRYSKTYTVRSPEFFEDVYRSKPTVFELEHYNKVKSQGNWTAEEGSAISKYAPGKTGPDYFRGALNLLHATYIGYHGDAHDWLTDNPQLTFELLNKCGYWYFLDQVKIPEPMLAGSENILEMVWENRGVAPAYRKYPLKLSLVGSDTLDIELESGNLSWMPDGINNEKYIVKIPKGTPPGQYDLRLKLFSNYEKKDVYLALDSNLMDGNNYYKIATVTIK
jgi:hypothetical protein